MKKRTQQSGFTLLELVLVIIILSVVAKAATTMLANGLNGYLTLQNTTTANWQSHLGLERMVRDITAIRSPNDITLATDSELAFTDTDGNRIHYQLNGLNLNRNTEILADGIQKLTFTYFDKNGALTESLSSIRYITISLNITLNNTNFTMVTTVNPRNLL